MNKIIMENQFIITLRFISKMFKFFYEMLFMDPDKFKKKYF